MLRTYYLILICILGSFFYLHAGDESEALLKKIQKKYNSAKDLSVKFEEHVQFGVTKNEQQFHGMFSMKKGNKFSIDMDQQSIVTDGKSVWTFNKTTNQVIIDTYRDEPSATSPERILANIPDTYNAVMIGTEIAGKVEFTVIKLTPKQKKSSMKSMKVWIDTDAMLMKKIQVLDTSDNLMTYTLDDIKINSGLPDSSFTFRPPSGASIVDLR
jgi:outer membrane lipoprotein carrier protein